MELKKERILIFKTDRVGDLILFSPCLNIIKDNIKNSYITLVCSEYNYKIAKNYKEIDNFIIIKKGKLFKTLFNNFKLLFLTKYKYLFQFDGKNSSYKISYFVKSKYKATICFIKNKKILGINFISSRPSKMMLGLFFDNYTYRDENYKINFKDNIVKSYQSLYFDILSNFNFEIKSKKNLFNLDMSYKNIFENFYVNKIENKYYLFHIDERWDTFSDDIYQKTILLLNYIAKKNKVIITTGIKDFSFLHDLEKKLFLTNILMENFLKKILII